MTENKQLCAERRETNETTVFVNGRGEITIVRFEIRKHPLVVFSAHLEPSGVFAPFFVAASEDDILQPKYRAVVASAVD
jgi:hypothetical protein